MCGIVGLVGNQEPRWLGDMNAQLRHRGPDDSGEYRDREAGVALAMQRLAILDLAGGRQPMVAAEDELVVVHNGEIFNAPELRRGLEDRGHRFVTTNSDTEILLRLWKERGEAMLDELNGMFAFVLYDRRRGILFGARDPIGIKPFYYAHAGGRFAFASELKGLLRVPWVDRDVDLEALFHYMSLRFVPGAASIVRGIHRLPPGHCFTYRVATADLTLRPYWRLRFSPECRSAAEFAALIRHELREAVRRWTLSDVPVACSLSGGLDSSAIVGLLAEAGHAPIRTYSLGFSGAEDAAWSELPLARKVAARWGTEHHEIVVSPDDLLEDLVKMVWHLDEPYGGGLPSWYVFQFMRRDVKVALTGTGGDELFGDYGRFAGCEASASGRPSGPSFERWPWPAGSVARRVSRLAEAWRPSPVLPPAAALSEAAFRRHYFDAHYYFPDGAKRAAVFDVDTSGAQDTSRLLYALTQQAEAPTLRDAIGSVAFNAQLPEEFLLMTDRFSMAHGLEARVPFLDRTFVELMARIPADVRTRPGDVKGLLKRAVADLIPRELLRARKRGFVLPTARWLRHGLRGLTEQLLAPDRLKAQGLFRPEFHAAYVAPHMTGAADHHAQIWTALMFQLWHVVFVEERATAAPSFTWRDLC